MRDGKRFRTSNLDLRVVLGTGGAASRIGFIVPKHGHSSVERNRLKRRLRELSRLRLLDLMRGANSTSAVAVVMRAQPGAYRLEYVQLLGEIELLRARMLKLLGGGNGEGPASEAAPSPGT